jgi:hypothetical protein
MNMRNLVALNLVMTLVAGCDDAHVTACFGDAEFCRHVVAANQAPSAVAEAPDDAAGGEVVVLDGTGSSDPDGRIVSYSWSQVAGDPVALEDADLATARFTAPDVEQTSTLEFRLTVVDDDDAADQASVSVRILPRADAALTAGVDLLNRSLTPPPVIPADACAEARSSDSWYVLAGIWLAAIGTGLDASDADAATVFLDSARVLLSHSRMLPPPGDGDAAVWRGGLVVLSDFADGRDPGLRDWSRRLAPTRPGGTISPPQMQGTIRVGLTASGALVAHAPDPRAALVEATDGLLGMRCDARLDPVRLAVYTLYLAGTSHGTGERLH